MVALEPIDVAEAIKRYPYFMDWLNELKRLPEDVLNFAICRRVEEVPLDTPFRKFVPTDNYTASITFKNDDCVLRTGKFSEGKMQYNPEAT